MPQLVQALKTINGRVYVDRGDGVAFDSDRLYTVDSASGSGLDVAALVVDGPQPYKAGDTNILTQTTDGRLRVELASSANLFASPSVWGGNPWTSSTTPWK